MKLLNRLFTNACIGTFAFAYSHIASAGTRGGYDATKGSGDELLKYSESAGTSQKLTKTTGNIASLLSDGLNLLLIAFTVTGIGLVGFSIWAIYKASVDERETPKKAIAGIFVGGALTAVTTISFLVRNNIVG